MTIDELLGALRDRDAFLYVEAGALRYGGPRLAPDDPIRAAIAEHRPLLVELFTYAPAGRCTVGECLRLRVEGDRCPDHPIARRGRIGPEVAA